VSLAKRGKESVTILDLNIISPEIAHFFNLIDEQKRVYPISLDECFRYLASGEDFDISTVVTTIKSVPGLNLICGPGNMKDEFLRLNETQWQYLIRKLSSFDYVLVDTPRYQNIPLFRALLAESERLILIQDQDLFGSYQASQFVAALPEGYKDKLEFWLSRYEEDSPIMPKSIEEIINLKARYCIPGIPRHRYIQFILQEKSFGQEKFSGYTEKLGEIADEFMCVKPEENKKGRLWKLWTWKRKSITT
jgi:hypothetical protein